MYYLCSEKKDADQLRGYREADLRLCFRTCKKPVFSRRGSIDLLSGTENGNAVINFKYHSHQSSTDITPVGASLLLHIHRRRKIRKGGKGKKIILSVTDHDEQSTSKDILTYLRTRVKKSRWKKLSLPLSVAQKFLNSGERGLSLRVNCAGCGRLVQLVFSNLNTPQKSQKRKRKRKKEAASENQRKRRKPRRNRERRNISTRPILVISTRQNHDL